jgi:hypothetical protein
MTLNLFTGADFKPLLAAKPSGDFLAAVTAGYKSTLASRPAERMGAIACDKVEMVPARGLLDGLAGLKQHYAAVAILPGLDCGSSDYAGFNGRFTMQDVILARMDRRRFKFSPSNLQAQRFLAQLNRPRSALRHDPFRDQPGSLPIIPLAQAHELIATAGLGGSLVKTEAGRCAGPTCCREPDLKGPRIRADQMRRSYPGAWPSRCVHDPSRREP